MRSPSEVAGLGHWPVSHSRRCAQRRRVSGVQAILAAIDSMAAHCEWYSLGSLANHVHRVLDDFEGILRLFLHGSILSNTGASTKPGAIHFIMPNRPTCGSRCRVGKYT